MQDQLNYGIKPNVPKDRIRPPLVFFFAFLKKITTTGSSHINMLFFPEVKSSPVIWVVPLNVGMLIWMVPFQWTSQENLSVQNLFRPCQFVSGTIQSSNFIVRPILTKFQVNFVLQLLFGRQIIRIVQKRIITFDKWIFTRGVERWQKVDIFGQPTYLVL